MRAVVIEKRGAPPVLRDLPEPTARDGAVLIDVETAGLGGWDVAGAYRLGIEYPCVVRGEGVGRAEDGRRVYFGERSVAPYGALAERTLVPSDEVWDVPDDVDDATAITMGIAGTGILLPLEAAGLTRGDRLLVVGGTGTLGQLGLRLGRHLGAGTVVAAARDAAALEAVRARGLADEVVVMTGAEDDVDRMRRASGGEGFDVVIDLVYGRPFEAALKATRWGARLVTVGTLAGSVASVAAGDLLYRTHTTVGTGQRSPAERHGVWRRLLGLAREADLRVPIVVHRRLDEGSAAWAAQAASPHAKILIDVAGAPTTGPRRKDLPCPRTPPPSP
ncbi:MULTISPECIES: zinc-binding dehydrogenase [Nocardia]|uniref:zinc-binding dehydrogenase n=1 Tax=Nocardia TaxID=1817 RepID=UPI000D69394B|nr:MULTISPECIES: zinc-binding dehydrogenase [Nocardia]